MRTYTGKFRSHEEIEKYQNTNYRTKTDKRFSNKAFRQTKRNLKLYDYYSIYTPNYKQRCGWGL